MDLKLNKKIIENTRIGPYDIMCLRHIFRVASESDGKNAMVDLDAIPQVLKGTIVHKYFHERLIYYRDTAGLIKDFKACDNGKMYYIELSDNFVDTLNFYIQTNLSGDELLKSYGRKEIIMNNSITIGTATNVAIQQGNKNSEQVVDFFSQERCEEIGDLLDGLVSLASQDSQLSRNVLDSFAEIKELLKSSPVEKDTIAKRITTFLQQVIANCTSASKVMTPIITLVNEIKKLIL